MTVYLKHIYTGVVKTLEEWEKESIAFYTFLYYDRPGIREDFKTLADYLKWADERGYFYTDLVEVVDIEVEKIERIKKIFSNLYNNVADTDWSLAADMFVAWNISNNFETKSFKEFVDWIDDDDINSTWHFFFGYGDDFKKFADDWVEEGEREDYLEYCEKI